MRLPLRLRAICPAGTPGVPPRLCLTAEKRHNGQAMKRAARVKPHVYSLACQTLRNIIARSDCAERDRLREQFRVATEEVARVIEAEYRLVAENSPRLAEFN